MTTQHQALVFILTWVAYASTYLLRKPIGVVKADLAEELSVSKAQLGWLDTALLLPYATVQLFCGSIADKLGARKTLGACLVLSSLSMVGCGYWPVFSVICLQLFANGAFQSLAWSSCTKIMSQCFSKEHRSSLFGVWGTCTFAGGIMGTALAVYLRAKYNWQMAFFIPSLFVGVVGILVLTLLREPPMGIPLYETAQEALTAPDKTKPEHFNLHWTEVWSIPMVKETAIAVFCIKLVRYCMMMWLPLYLHQELKYSLTEAGLYSTIFDFGGVLGTAAMGYILTRCFHRKSFQGTSVVTLGSALSLCGFYITGHMGALLSQGFVLLVGAGSGGVDNLLTGPIAADLGELEGRNAQASVSGFLNGFGTLGSVVEGPVIGMITEMFGWGSMLYLMITLSFLSALALLRAHIVQARIHLLPAGVSR